MLPLQRFIVIRTDNKIIARRETDVVRVPESQPLREATVFSGFARVSNPSVGISLRIGSTRYWEQVSDVSIRILIGYVQ